MLHQLHCGSASGSCRGGDSRRGRSAMSVSCLFTTLAVLVAFPASVVARTGPVGNPATDMVSYLERTPVLAAPNHAKLEALLEPAARNPQTIERMDHLRIEPQEAASIFHFHREHGRSSSSSSNNRRGLVGSSPPTCKSKCGTCQPCKAVHIAIGSPHGVISETEYYPEVWRCQCGNRYYMP